MVSFSFDIDNDKGYHVIDGLEGLDYTKDVISISKSAFSKLDKDSIDWKSKSQLFTRVLEDFKIDEEVHSIKKKYSNIGAVSTFIGYVWNNNENKTVRSIELEVY